MLLTELLTTLILFALLQILSNLVMIILLIKYKTLLINSLEGSGEKVELFEDLKAMLNLRL